MYNLVLAFGCLACVGHGWQVQALGDQRQGADRGDLPYSTAVWSNIHALAKVDHSSRQRSAQDKLSAANVFSMLLMAFNLASANHAPIVRQCCLDDSIQVRKCIGHSTPLMLKRDDSTYRSSQRRELLHGALATFLALSTRSAQAAGVTGEKISVNSGACQTDSDPFKTIVTCINYGIDDGRLRGCNPDESCVATSQDTSTVQYAIPWTPFESSRETADPPRAWRAVVAAIEDQSDLKIVDRVDDKFYLRATANAVVPPGGVDDVEFLLKVDEKSRPIVFFRSSTRQTVYLYPLQQPVPNQKSHVDRLKSIRTRLQFDQQGGKSATVYGALDQDKAPKRDNVFGLQLFGSKVPDFDKDFDD